MPDTTSRKLRNLLPAHELSRVKDYLSGKNFLDGKEILDHLLDTRQVSYKDALGELAFDCTPQLALTLQRLDEKTKDIKDADELIKEVQWAFDLLVDLVQEVRNLEESKTRNTSRLFSLLGRVDIKTVFDKVSDRSRDMLFI